MTEREVEYIYDGVHFARRQWPCVLCEDPITYGNEYRYVRLTDKKTLLKAHKRCTDAPLRKQVIQRFASLTGHSVEEVEKAWEGRAID